MHSYAPLVRGHLDPLSALRESLNLPALLADYVHGRALAEILPTPMRESVTPQRIEVCAVAGGRVLLSAETVNEDGVRGDELDILHVDDGAICLAPVDLNEALQRVHAGAMLALLGSDTDAVLHLALMEDKPWGPGKNEAGGARQVSTGKENPTSNEAAVVGEREPRMRWETLRTVGHLLSDDDTQKALMATALAAWHDQMRFCPACGQRPEPWASGWVRRCPACGHMEYPRQDPAVIMTVVDRLDRVLLAHNRAWSDRRVSVLAGFVDAGEAPERAVVREVWEEVGLRVAEVETVATQPWPFPRSLMLGYHARLDEGDAGSEQGAAGMAVPIPDGTEIEWASFYSRGELVEAVRSGDIVLPGPSTIAHGLLRRWFGGALPGCE
ncbi:NAD(+) diphosphatase [Schaalia canis]|uniref:NAD(+) diphosphatase n=1 Tax=Schaalia canis TaxID=100469 RepID=A0A3P1SE33_9ACTO|nr:NAD(+) diphosphatase [Schaalia canis]RRC95296.1 NAD(+) diphosphatase [Schaalia canis]